MGRPKEYDRENVLDKAMHVFWSKGYECASMQDLVDAMGINRGSIYAEFGDKRGLHLAALDLFYKQEIRRMMAPIDQPGPRLDAIRQIFDEIVADAVERRDCKGCMIYNTAVELCPNDDEVTAKVAAGLKRAEDTFFEALIEAKTTGELREDRDARALARYLTNSVNGLRVIGMVMNDRPALQDVIDQTLSIFD
jgi:TetR/AcrR family transcriptional repressor of nem operon